MQIKILAAVETGIYSYIKNIKRVTELIRDNSEKVFKAL
jgi:hypothetical protein